MRRTRPRRPREVFLSHASGDRHLLNPLATFLRSHHIPVWFSEKHIQGGQKWHDEIGAALDRCDCFLLLLTPRATRSKWVKRELLYALNEDRLEDRIIPLLLKPCEPQLLSWTLPSFQMIDFTRDWEEGAARLLKAMEIRSK
ncbi:MAG: toll/interleukin-1 receptor domain-containing protein [Phycisphaeraceae bacterium]